jgi:hypothetical protein
MIRASVEVKVGNGAFSESAHLENRLIGAYCVPRENASAVQSSFARRKRGFEDSSRGVVRAHRRKGRASAIPPVWPPGLFRPHAYAAVPVRGNARLSEGSTTEQDYLDGAGQNDQVQPE